MVLELILALVIGVTAGTLTGLIPGIHVNLITVLLLSATPLLAPYASPLSLVIGIVSMAITHTFLDFIPTIFLGAPDEDSFLSILPGHTLLLKGHGYAAIVLSTYGGIVALIIIGLYTFPFVYLLPFVYPYVARIMPLILLTVIGFLIYKEKEKIRALVVFLLAGFLGIAVLNLPLQEPFLPLLTGLFGASTLIISISQKTKIPEQKILSPLQIRMNASSIVKATGASIIAAPFTAFLPGLGASQAAVIGSEVIPVDQKEFIFIIGAINTIVMGLSFITLYSVQRTRTGAALAIDQLLPEFTLPILLTVLGVIGIVGIVACFLTLVIARVAAQHVTRVPYQQLAGITLSILVMLVILFTHPFTIQGAILGLIIFTTSTALGIFTILSGVKRMQLMGALLIPTILFYLL